MIYDEYNIVEICISFVIYIVKDFLLSLNC